MSIEKNLDRIAGALEALLEIASAEAPNVGKPKAGVKAGASAASAQTSSDPTTSGAEAAEPKGSENGVTKESLRALLNGFQTEHGVPATKALIEPFGVTIGKIKPGDYQAVADAIEAYDGT